jgi:hypothetical protein
MELSGNDIDNKGLYNSSWSLRKGTRGLLPASSAQHFLQHEQEGHEPPGDLYPPLKKKYLPKSRGNEL